MAVELEEITLFGLFSWDRKTIQIKEEHFKEIEIIAKNLTPIPIEYQKLYKLGFIRNPDGVLYRQQGTCEFMLRPLKGGSWEFLINGGQRIRIVTYIHYIQRLWFDLFDDHLFLPKAKQSKDKLRTSRS